MSKFKVGDKVVVNEVAKWVAGRTCVFTDVMVNYIGKEYVISGIKGSYYRIDHDDEKSFFYEEEWLSLAEDDHPVYKGGKIDVEKLKEILVVDGDYLAIYQDGSMAIRGYVDNESCKDIAFDYDELNTLYKEITTSKKASLMDQIAKDSIEQEIKKMEDAIAELRKQLV